MPVPEPQSHAENHGLRDTALTMVGLLGFGVLTWIYAVSRPEPPTLRENQRDERLVIRQEVESSEAEAMAGVEAERLSVEEGIEIVPAAFAGREVAVTTEDPQFVVPDSATAEQLSGATPASETEESAEEAAESPDESAKGSDGEGDTADSGTGATTTEATEDPSGEGETVAEGTDGQPDEAEQPEPEVLALDGGALYSMHCAACHQADGQGMPAAQWPPLAGSEWLEQPVEVLARIVLHGLSGPITVSGEEYGQGIMLPLGSQLEDTEIAAVLNHVRETFSEAELASVTAAQVGAVREETSERDPAAYWTVEELQPFLEGESAN